MTEDINRYTFEHRYLPDRYFQGKASFLLYLAGGREALFQNLLLAYLVADEPCPFELEELAIQYFTLRKNYFLVYLTMPYPTDSHECSNICLLFEKEFKYQTYFTVERTIAGDFILGEWDANGNHFFHGSIEPEDEIILKRCQEIFFKRYLD